MTSTVPTRQSGITADTYADFAGAKECDRFLRGICKTRCVDPATGQHYSLDQEHIVPKACQSSDCNDLANLRLMCSNPNRYEKGDKPDDYYVDDTSNFFDQELNDANLRPEQREKGPHLVETTYRNLFSKMPDNLFKVFMVLSWLVGTGKTIGMIGVLLKINEMRRQKQPYGWRIRRVLWLVHQRSLVDSIALELGGKDLGGNEIIESELVQHGVTSRAPRVGTVKCAEDWINLSDKEIVVACPQAIWETENRALSPDVLRRYLGGFDAIVIDESQYAVDQYLQLHDLAPKTLKFAVSSTHFDKDMVFLSQLGGGAYQDRFRLFSVSGYTADSDIFKRIMPVFALTNDQLKQMLAGKDESEYISDLIEKAKGSDNVIGNLPQLNADYYMAQDGEDQEKACGGEQLAADDPRKESRSFNGVRTSAVVNYAIKQAKRLSSSYGYDVHVMVRTGSIADAVRLSEVYSSSEATDLHGKDFAASCVYAGSKGAHLGDPNHPWMLAKRTGGKAIRGSKRIVVVVDIGQFGINQPACAIIAWVDPVLSVIDIVQRLGRAIRKKKNIGGAVHVVWDADSDRNGEFRLRLHQAVDYILNMEEYVTEAFLPLDELDDLTVFSGSRTIAPNIPAQRKAEIAEVLGEVLIDEPIVHIDRAWDIVVDKVYGGQEPKNGTKKQLREIIGAIASGDQDDGFHDRFFSIPQCHEPFSYVIGEKAAKYTIKRQDVIDEIMAAAELRESMKRQEIAQYDQGISEVVEHWTAIAKRKRDREFRIPQSTVHPHQILGVNQRPRNWPKDRELPADKRNMERSYSDRLRKLFSRALEHAINSAAAREDAPPIKRIRAQMYSSLNRAINKSLYRAAAEKLEFTNFQKATIRDHKDQIAHVLCSPLVAQAILGYAQGLVLQYMADELPGMNRVFQKQVNDISNHMTAEAGNDEINF
jgi:hypothetical protein